MCYHYRMDTNSLFLYVLLLFCAVLFFFVQFDDNDDALILIGSQYNQVNTTKVRHLIGQKVFCFKICECVKKYFTFTHNGQQSKI